MDIPNPIPAQRLVKTANGYDRYDENDTLINREVESADGSFAVFGTGGAGCFVSLEGEGGGIATDQASKWTIAAVQFTRMFLLSQGADLTVTEVLINGVNILAAPAVLATGVEQEAQLLDDSFSVPENSLIEVNVGTTDTVIVRVE